MASTQVIPPPYKGQNDLYPIISIQNPYCEKLYNFNNKKGVAQLRMGNDKFSTQSPAGGGSALGLNILSYQSGSVDKLIVLVDDAGTFKWYDITTGTPSLMHSRGPGAGDDEIHTLYFNGYLFYWGEANLTTGEYYNGSTWGNIGYTFSSPFNSPFGGCVYKNRAYMIGRYSATYAYSGIDSITGACTTVNLGSVISSGADLYIIRSTSTTESATQANLLAFIFSNGDILVYSGSYPDSDSWGLVSRFKISTLFYFNTAIDAKGDSFILTQNEILSLRGLLATGYTVEKEQGIGATIQRRYNQVIKAHVDGDLIYGIRGTYDEVNDRLFITFPRYVNPTTGALVTESSFQLVYDFILGAWYEYYQIGNTGISISNSACFHIADIFILLLSATGGISVVYKLDSQATYLDDMAVGSSTLGIPYDLKTAPLPIAKFGANAIDGVEVICKTDLYPQTNYKFIADLGRQSTNNQALPDQGTAVAKPMMNVGIQGSIVTQLEISGTSISSSLGLELYAFNVWYNQGAPASR